MKIPNKLLSELPVGFSVSVHHLGEGIGWQWRYQDRKRGIDLTGTAGICFTLLEAIEAGMAYLKRTPFLSPQEKEEVGEEA